MNGEEELLHALTKTSGCFYKNAVLNVYNILTH